MINIKQIKNNFPVFSNNPGLIYLDSAATSFKPQPVICAMVDYYEKYPASVHRGIYKISEQATAKYEETRQLVANFINAKNPDEIVFVRNTTEAVNLVAYTLGRQIIEQNDEIVTSVMEHHSNFIPWQQLAIENGAIFKVVDVTEDGYLDLNVKNLGGVITKKTKILALTLVSNVLGTINPIKKIIRSAKKINPKIVVIVDAAQAVPHMPIDVTDSGADFVAFSGHKMLGPTGVGVLWGKYELLEKMFPFNFGGGMIRDVGIEKTQFLPPPGRFEAGTPAIADVIGLGEAIKYLQTIGMKEITAYEKALVSFAYKRLTDSFGDTIRILGPGLNEDRTGLVSFTFKNYHPHDIAQILDEENMCVRAGHHCAMPLHKRYGLAASCRMSLYIYNDKKDIERLIEGLRKVEMILK